MGGIRQNQYVVFYEQHQQYGNTKKNLEPPIRDILLWMIFVLELQGELRRRKKLSN
jgi:hypothetical protein